MKKRKLAPLALTAFLALGCTRNFTDTEGRAFVEVCEGDKCQLHEKGDGETPRFRFEANDNVLSVCPFESKKIQECRALVCESNGDCSSKANSGFGCDEGMCRDVAKKRSTNDKVVECLGGTGPWSGNVKQRERVTLAVACAEGCELPAECRRTKKKEASGE